MKMLKIKFEDSTNGELGTRNGEFLVLSDEWEQPFSYSILK